MKKGLNPVVVLYSFHSCLKKHHQGPCPHSPSLPCYCDVQLMALKFVYLDALDFSVHGVLYMSLNYIFL